MAVDIKTIQQYCKSGRTVYTKHFLDRCRKRDILLDEAEAAVMDGEIIEDYPDDYPFPSCLILGLGSGYNKLHVVCAQGEGQLYMISAYRPSPEKWESDLRTRKENQS